MKKERAVLLLSGGFDSGVAGYLLEKEGFEIIPLHLSNVDFVGEWTIEKCIEIAKKFNWSKLYVMDIANSLQTFVNECTHSYFFVFMKRLLLVLASELAKRENASYIVTGESLGQVSSQTLLNINVIEKATKFRVLKPLIAMDKETIIGYSKQIGTFEISSGPEVCDILGPKHPVTQANEEKVKNEEDKINYSQLINQCIATLKVIEVN
ncbi:MAG: 7-cyano-7-deazaguanine synthase [Candidatus Heimdallarchaeum aukensis]|uniref:7-cyano-7-deazaguanine synthase n=1 Tax=Candidatus Heimdallarchaeum aukensis TaxID=2876573 RepID=A0A9Y1BP91_9ARCH|nr:MAG: 7-cyano-7-deazaguanine synthase [Candidatus Heimdallarchaeum aukensis]